jgi:hypothetical protein
MPPWEQLKSPERGLEDDEVTEFVAFLFADVALGIVKGIEKLGLRKLLSSLVRSQERNGVKAFDYFDPITKTYPNSPYKIKTVNPSEIAEQINQKVTAELKAAINSNKTAAENSRIQALHDRYIRTGEWTFEGLDDWQFPDKTLQQLHQDYIARASLY